MITIFHVTRDASRRSYDLLRFPRSAEVDALVEAASESGISDTEKMARVQRYRAAKAALLSKNAITLVAEGGYQKMAEIETNDLEHAYKITQNGVVTDSWTLEPPVGCRPLVAPTEHDGKIYGHRSSDVGDIFERDGTRYLVGDFGFVEIVG